jgi:hypothetical protein
MPGLPEAQLLIIATMANFLADNRKSMAKAQEKAGSAWLKDEEGQEILDSKEVFYRNSVFMLGAGSDTEGLNHILPEDCVGEY